MTGHSACITLTQQCDFRIYLVLCSEGRNDLDVYINISDAGTSEKAAPVKCRGKSADL